ncbi:MAG: CobD/CbiB family cobalamin biosynthesis protein, partial [Candidatus Nitrosotenuis sp.]
MISIFIVIGAILLDLVLGDPRTKYHPTAWVGTLIGKVTPFVKSTNPTIEKIGGIIMTISITGLVALLLVLFEITSSVDDIIFTILMIILGSILLKTTIAIRGLELYGNQVMESINKDNLDQAKDRLAKLVKRNTKQLDKNHIVSGVLESTSENIVDGVTGPLFYFGL